jgi:hypothetical protein
MRGSTDMAGTPDVKSRRAFFRYEIVSQNRPLEVKCESTADFSHSEMRAASGHFFGTRFGHISSLAFLSSSSVATFRNPNSDTENGVCFATSWHTREIIAPKAPYFHGAFLNIRPNSPSDGERCMKHTVHPVVHFSVHRRIFGKVRRRRSCTWRERTIGRGQNIGLGWSDPTFVHVSVPKVIRGVAPAQLRGNRAECFARRTFHSSGPQ